MNKKRHKPLPSWRSHSSAGRWTVNRSTIKIHQVVITNKGRDNRDLKDGYDGLESLHIYLMYLSNRPVWLEHSEQWWNSRGWKKKRMVLEAPALSFFLWSDWRFWAQEWCALTWVSPGSSCWCLVGKSVDELGWKQDDQLRKGWLDHGGSDGGRHTCLQIVSCHLYVGWEKGLKITPENSRRGAALSWLPTVKPADFTIYLVF